VHRNVTSRATEVFASDLKTLAGGIEPNFHHAVYLSEKVVFARVCV
jgi:hypothetical protein